MQLQLLLQLLLLVLALEFQRSPADPEGARMDARVRRRGMDAPYGASPRRVLDLVACDLKQAFFFGYFLLSR
ncbi:hypothetical protein [Lysobacter enzymogenes]|uniref:hypothetical protein n=1 Tax=Lysobacter enzymogenes TaxID=69 RepID=UPI001AFA759C|nr:hypothetical protein [Lysobacter enzymogenes]QQQ01143.1 hypothetical protein JHW41_24350 [Lysobacter enzymogenes]